MDLTALPSPYSRIVRRLPQPPESGCGIFDGPKLGENWMQVTFFYGLALPHMSINSWICFWCILFTFQQLRRTFVPAFFLFFLLSIAQMCGKHSYWSEQKSQKCVHSHWSVESTPIGPHKRLKSVSTSIGRHWFEALREVLSSGGLKNDISRWRSLLWYE